MFELLKCLLYSIVERFYLSKSMELRLIGLNSIGPILKENNVRLVGIGLGYNSLDGG